MILHSLTKQSLSLLSLLYVYENIQIANEHLITNFIELDFGGFLPTPTRHLLAALWELLVQRCAGKER